MRSEPAPPSRPVRVHVDRLVVDAAFGHLDREALGASVARELGRLLADGGAPEALARRERVGRVDGGVVTLAPDADAETVGRRIARSVHRGIAP